MLQDLIKGIKEGNLKKYAGKYHTQPELLDAFNSGASFIIELLLEWINNYNDEA